MEGKTNFSRRLKQSDGLTWLTPTLLPLILDRSTVFTNHIPTAYWMQTNVYLRLI